MSKNNKKIFIIIFCISLSLIACIIVGTYARYITSASGNANVKIAKWDIKVNSQSIKSNSNLTNLITPVIDSNDNIASGVIAPNATGYFDLNLDFTNADVSCNYSITVSSLTSSVKDLIVTGYSVDNGTTRKRYR